PDADNAIYAEMPLSKISWLDWIVRLLAAPLVALGIAAGLLGAAALVVQFFSLNGFHDRFIVWAVAGIHEHRRWLIVLFMVLIALLACLVWRSSQRRKGWLPLVSTFAFVGTFAALCGYLIWPFGLLKETPWIAFLALAIYVWVWVRGSWLLWPGVYGRSRRTVVDYLESEPRAESYFKLQEAVYPESAATATCISRNRIAPPSEEKPVKEQPDSCKLLKEFVRCLPDLPWHLKFVTIFVKSLDWLIGSLEKRKGIGEKLSRVRPKIESKLARWIVPQFEGSLADREPLLYCELNRRHDVLWQEYEEILYGQSKLPELTPNLAQQARQAFWKWLQNLDALGECLLFGADNPERNPRHRELWLKAVTLFAEASRRCLEPTHRRLDREEFLLLEQAKGPKSKKEIHRLAQQFLHKEIRCLDRLLPPTADLKLLSNRPLDQRPFSSLKKVCDSTAKATDLQVLLAFRWLVVHGISATLASNSDSQSAPNPLIPNRHWQQIFEVFAKRSGRIVQQSSQGQVAPFDLAVALDCRARFLDAALENNPQQLPLMRDMLRRYSLPQNADPHLHPWLAYDFFIHTQVDEEEARQSSHHSVNESTVERALRHARGYINALASCSTAKSALLPFNSQRLSFRALEEAWGQDFRHLGARLRSSLNPFCSNVQGPPVVPVGEVTWQQWTARLKHHRFLDRKPNVFAFPQVAFYGIVGMLLCLILFIGMKNGPVMAHLDYRLGEPGIQDIQTLAAGQESLPSQWVGTKNQGVQVKAPGENFHWQSITTENSELPTNDVRRISVGAENVAYLCADVDQLQLAVSSVPLSPPGRWPTFRLDNWRHIIGTTRFGYVSDEDITQIRQHPRLPLVLMGTHSSGVGGYLADQRQWLDVSLLNQKLPDSNARVWDFDFLETPSNTFLAVGTAKGLAAGPLGDLLTSRLPADEWWTIPAEPLLSPQIPELQFHPEADGSLLSYRSANAGLGTIELKPNGEIAHHVRVSPSRVDGLTESGMQWLDYQPSAGKLWITHKAGNPNAHSLSVYHESDHGWINTELPFSRESVLDLAVDLSRDREAYFGTDQGLYTATESGNRLNISSLSFLNQRVPRVVSSETQIGDVAVVSMGQPSSPKPSLSRLMRTDKGIRETQTLVGSRRFDGLDLSSIRMVEPRTDSNAYYFATPLGIAQVEPTTREIFPAFPNSSQQSARAAALQSPRDLAVVSQKLLPNNDNSATPENRDHWLMQVSDDNGIDMISLTKPAPVWRPFLNHTASDVVPSVLNSSKVFQGELYLGSSDRVSSYDMAQRRWTSWPGLPGLETLFVSDTSLWGFSETNNGQSLHTLAQADPAKNLPPRWQSQFQNVRAFDHTDERVAVVDQNGVVKSGDAQGRQQTAMSPVFLPKSQLKPTTAAVKDHLLYLAPVPGGIGEYNQQTHQWKVLPT
ncbi:MAG: hypothetical protein KDA84_10530, partial [Planctomycetaceae bacterium]|nr:hypothetical protein [Planctomycetaceae bacterium]